MADFVLLGADSDETRLLLDRATGYSVSIPGHPVLSVPSQDARPRYDVIVTLRDIAVEHGFRVDEVPATTDPNELARALSTAYAKNRAPVDSNVTIKPITQRLRPSAAGGAQGVYPLRDAPEPMMEQIWVMVRSAPNGLWALYHTTRFRNEDVNILRWAHLRASMIDQHHWDPAEPRSAAGEIWPASSFALPSAKLDFTESAWSEAQSKAKDMGVVSDEQRTGLVKLLRDLTQTDEPPKTLVLPPIIQIFTNRIAMHGPTQAAEAILRNFERCKNMLDVRGWAWQCAWAIGNRESLNAPGVEQPMKQHRITTYDAFSVGYWSAYAAIPFRGVEILGALATHVTGELARAINDQIEHYRSKNAQTVETVLRVNAILATAGLPQPRKPTTYAEYQQWAHTARATLSTATRTESTLEGALLVGGSFATLLAALVLEDIMLTFRVRAPNFDALRINSHAAASEVDQARDHLAANAKHPGVSLAVRTISHECLEYARQRLTTPLDADVQARWNAVGETLRYANGRVSDLDSAIRK